MKCCKCTKEVDVSKSEIPPKWYASYEKTEMKVMICAECVADPQTDKLWRDGKWAPVA